MNKSFYMKILTLPVYYSLPFSMTEDMPLSQLAVEETVQPLPAWMLEAAAAASQQLHFIDQGQYEESWLKGDELFEKMTSKKEWAHLLKETRQPLGQVKQRALKQETIAHLPKGLPEGEYMIIEYVTSFEKGIQAEERLTLRRGAEGQWRLLTYRLY